MRATEGDELTDRAERWPVLDQQVMFSGSKVVEVRRDRVTAPGGGEAFERDVVLHPGGIGIVALDEEERMLLVHQYRHPVGHRLLEAPAGLLDVAGEPYQEAAARELFEEGHVRANDWRVLVDFFTSPGMCDEATRVFLARGLVEVPPDQRHEGEAEEADMPVTWRPLAEVVEQVLAGQLHNPIVCVGALAAWTARNGQGYQSLRPAGAPWPAREALPR